MFRIEQVVPLEKFRKQLKDFVKFLNSKPQAILITMKNGEPLVLVNGKIFEELLDFKLQHDFESSFELLNEHQKRIKNDHGFDSSN